ncbi:MFS transporter [Brevibacillus agri]|uniref:MFS transporter n=1 Tax=Brevibacillus agri TaxID=51101 RepID=UPI002E212A0B|nr:MFS transporter [Brevibacillus agri]MED1654622.1 MFS transporter [Brevibacillus agri]MED1687451.1 MFS transporter [Brevibacillus agri]MED1691829.1 MFS transporter [Brevibacillus agri]MED1700412.1 MFS transporter [Brevibacillus agri]
MVMNATHVYMTKRFATSLANATMFTTYALYYIAALGLNPFELLLVGMVLELSVLLFEGVTGVVADTYSRRLSVIIGMFLLGTAFVLQGILPAIDGVLPFVSAFMWVLVAQVFCGVGDTFVSGADTAWIADEVGEEKLGSIFMRAKRYSLLANMLGIGLSVWLSTLAPNLPYLVGGLIYLGLGVFLILFMQETGFTPRERERGASHWREMAQTWLSGAHVIRRQPILLLILLVTLFTGAASEGYDRLREAHLISEIGFPQLAGISMAMWFGIIAALSSLLGLFAVSFAEKRLDVNNGRVVIVGMFVLTALKIAALISFAMAPDFGWALAALLLIGAIESLINPLYDTWLNLNIESSVRATVLSMMSQSNAFGQTAGGPAVGWIGNRLSIRASLLTAALLLLPILAVFGRVLRRR